MPLLLGVMPFFAAEDKDLCPRIAPLPFASSGLCPFVPWGPPGFGNRKLENFPGVSLLRELQEEQKCCSGVGCDRINMGWNGSKCQGWRMQ